MRLSRALLTSVIVCSVVFFVVLHSITEIRSDLKSDVQKPCTEKQKNYKSQTYRYVTPSLAELGVRGSLPKRNKHVLMLTRVPDAGAELLVLILQRLQGYNAFKHIRLPPGDHGLFSTLQEELFVEEITNIIRQEAIPLSFDGDVRFLNFSKFGRHPPTFISLVRNPVDERNLQRYHRGEENMLESRAIPTFCGQDPRCAEINNKWALQRAKANIVEWYPFVGILDCMEQSIGVLEYKFPYFFHGAKQVYKKILSKRKHFSEPMLTLKLQETDIPFKHLEDEIELYQWLKLRLLKDALSASDETNNL